MCTILFMSYSKCIKICLMLVISLQYILSPIWNSNENKSRYLIQVENQMSGHLDLLCLSFSYKDYNGKRKNKYWTFWTGNFFPLSSSLSLALSSWCMHFGLSLLENLPFLSRLNSFVIPCLSSTRQNYQMGLEISAYSSNTHLYGLVVFVRGFSVFNVDTKLELYLHIYIASFM